MRGRPAFRLGLALLLAFGASALAQVNDITLSNGASLQFGQIVAGGTSGTVIVSPSGTRTSMGGTTLGNSAGARAAAFTVTGDVDATYGITLPSATTLSSGSDTMTVDAFTHDATGVLAGGSETFHVGATLHVAGSQVSGSYSGTFMVIVTYD